MNNSQRLSDYRKTIGIIWNKLRRTIDARAMRISAFWLPRHYPSNHCDPDVELVTFQLLGRFCAEKNKERWNIAFCGGDTKVESGKWFATRGIFGRCLEYWSLRRYGRSICGVDSYLVVRLCCLRKRAPRISWLRHATRLGTEKFILAGLKLVS